MYKEPTALRDRKWSAVSLIAHSANHDIMFPMCGTYAELCAIPIDSRFQEICISFLLNYVVISSILRPNIDEPPYGNQVASCSEINHGWLIKLQKRL